MLIINVIEKGPRVQISYLFMQSDKVIVNEQHLTHACRSDQVERFTWKYTWKETRK